MFNKSAPHHSGLSVLIDPSIENVHFASEIANLEHSLPFARMECLQTNFNCATLKEKMKNAFPSRLER